LKDVEAFTCPICDWRVKIPRDTARPQLEDLQYWADEMPNLPFQPVEEEILKRIINKARAFRDFLQQFLNDSQICPIAEEMLTMRFYLRKLEGAEVLLAYETNTFRQELHKWQPIGPDPPPVLEQSLSTRKLRPTMKELGVEMTEDLPPQLRAKTIVKRKSTDPSTDGAPRSPSQQQKQQQQQQPQQANGMTNGAVTNGSNGASQNDSAADSSSQQINKLLANSHKTLSAISETAATGPEPEKGGVNILKHKRESAREESEPLAEPINSSSRASAPPKKQQSLAQMQLDFGGDTRKTCGECGMEYVPSNDEDATLHRMYHNMNGDGVELGKTFMKSAMKWVYEVAHIEGVVVVVDRKISPPAGKVVQKVLRVVNKELSATDITDDVLWSQRSLSEGAGSTGQGVVKQSDAERRNGNKSDRYKIFLHVKNEKCVRLCLAERITKAHRVKDNRKSVAGGHELSSNHKSSSIYIEEETVPAVVGVSRIWTSKSSRRKGIANNLLDSVLNQFIYGMEIEKDELAFNQPTESGGELAKAWYGEESGWLVYIED
jgi:N-acetyltransferase